MYRWFHLQASNGQGHHAAFASAPASPSGVRLQTGAAPVGGGGTGDGNRRRSHQGRRGGHAGNGGGGENNDRKVKGRRARSQLIFVGTGSSTAVPGCVDVYDPLFLYRMACVSFLVCPGYIQYMSTICFYVYLVLVCPGHVQVYDYFCSVSFVCVPYLLKYICVYV